MDAAPSPVGVATASPVPPSEWPEATRWVSPPGDLSIRLPSDPAPAWSRPAQGAAALLLVLALGLLAWHTYAAQALELPADGPRSGYDVSAEPRFEPRRPCPVAATARRRRKPGSPHRDVSDRAWRISGGGRVAAGKWCRSRRAGKTAALRLRRTDRGRGERRQLGHEERGRPSASEQQKARPHAAHRHQPSRRRGIAASTGHRAEIIAAHPRCSRAEAFSVGG